MVKWCKWEAIYDPSDETYMCTKPEHKGFGIACEPCQSKEDDPVNGCDCFEED